ncbi:MAG TPA: hypothetical protein VGX52_03075 [Burkholderiales bacterium]|nr:hypothetical protein [Burkholderiales bacterium]
MPADAAIWTVDLSLRRIRDCAALASLLKSADPQLKELARQVAMLETVVLELAREHRIEGLA